MVALSIVTSWPQVIASSLAAGGVVQCALWGCLGVGPAPPQAGACGCPAGHARPVARSSPPARPAAPAVSAPGRAPMTDWFPWRLCGRLFAPIRCLQAYFPERPLVTALLQMLLHGITIQIRPVSKQKSKWRCIESSSRSSCEGFRHVSSLSLGN